MAKPKIHKYAGIGSRKTPDHVLKVITDTAKWLKDHNYILYSGGAKGADTAFEKGASYLCRVFRANDATPEALALAKKYHPTWDRMPYKFQKLHGRNAFQVLGEDLKTPVDFVICWTPDGAETHEQRSIATGGTGTAISIASEHGIRVYNLANESSVNELREKLREIKTSAKRPRK